MPIFFKSPNEHSISAHFLRAHSETRYCKSLSSQVSLAWLNADSFFFVYSYMEKHMNQNLVIFFNETNELTLGKWLCNSCQGVRS